MKRRSGTQLILAVCLITIILANSSLVGQSSSASAPAVPVPRLIQFSGIARDADGKPLTATIGITFLLYKDEQGGAPLWMETQNVQPDSKGHYSVQLGVTKPDGLPTGEFNSAEARWLGVEITGQAEQPRVLLLAVPYALKAADAATIGGLPPSAFLRATPGGVVTGANESSGKTVSQALSKSEQPQTLKGVKTNGGTANFVPLWTAATTIGNSALFQSSSGHVGLNTTSPGASLEIDSPNQLGLALHAPFSGVGVGLDFATTGTGGKQWEILATGTGAAQGPSKLNIRDVSSGADVFTIAPGGLVGIGIVSPGTILQVTDKNNSSISAVIAGDMSSSNPGAAAVFGDALATSGTTRGVFGQIFSSSSGAAGVLGEAQATSGQTTGVQGYNFSSGQYSAGVEGVASPGSGVTFGAIHISNSPNGTGALGLGQGQSSTGLGIVGCCPLGVWGDTGSSAGGAAGLVGTADDARAIYLQNNSPSGVPTAFMFQGASGKLALVAGGAVGACTVDTNGDLACHGSKSAVVPVDNSQRQVALYAVEAPQNWFEDFGSERLAGGAVTVLLEPTFAQTVNTASDYHVFLTPRADCEGLYVANATATGFEVRELRGGRSNVAFDYRIVALRRGYENVRLEDKTAVMAKVKENLIKPSGTAGPRFTPLARPEVPVLPARPTTSASHSTP